MIHFRVCEIVPLIRHCACTHFMLMLACKVKMRTRFRSRDSIIKGSNIKLELFLYTFKNSDLFLRVL